MVGELLLSVGFVGAALSSHTAALLGCLFGARWVRHDRPVLTVLALVPLFRIVNLGMPRALAPTATWVALVYLALIPGIYYAASSPEIPPIQAGIRSLPMGFLPAVAGGLLLGEISYWLLSPPALAYPTVAGVALLTGVMVLIVAPVEELLFRGLLQRTLDVRFGVLPGLVAASLAYGLFYVAHHTAFAVVAVGLALVFGVVYNRTESLALVALAHGVANAYLYGYRPVYGFPMELVAFL